MIQDYTEQVANTAGQEELRGGVQAKGLVGAGVGGESDHLGRGRWGKRGASVDVPRGTRMQGTSGPDSSVGAESREKGEGRAAAAGSGGVQEGQVGKGHEKQWAGAVWCEVLVSPVVRVRLVMVRAVVRVGPVVVCQVEPVGCECRDASRPTPLVPPSARGRGVSGPRARP